MLVENTELIASNISRDTDGELMFAGRRVSELAEKYLGNRISVSRRFKQLDKFPTSSV